MREVLFGEIPKMGFLKCRLIHMEGRSVVQPDVLFLHSGTSRSFYVPQFFDPNQAAFFDDGDQDFCRLTMVVGNGILLRVGFFRKDKIKNCRDGSLIYRCGVAKVQTKEKIRPSGRWRRKGNRFELELYHHTTEEALQSILATNELWSSKRNIKGDGWLANIAYGYFTCIPKISSEAHLLQVAMSSSGLTGFIPTNAPLHSRHVTALQVPLQDVAKRAHTLRVWVDSELLAPNHLWLHRPLDKPAYYEVVLPMVFRVGVKPSTSLLIKRGAIIVPAENRKLFHYVIVGDADTPEGLVAPYFEEETTSIAVVESFPGDDDLIAFWKRNGNRNLFGNRTIELASIKGAAE